MRSEALPRRCFLALAASAALPIASPLQRSSPLFFIARSKNANIVQYDAVEQSAGQLEPNGPIAAYWILLAEDGRREPLSRLDHVAYGFRVVPERGGSWLLTLKAAPSRAIRVLSWQGRWVAQMVIAKRSALLNRIFVATDESGLLPRVRSVDVYGTDMLTGRPLSERLT